MSADRLPDEAYKDAPAVDPLASRRAVIARYEAEGRSLLPDKVVHVRTSSLDRSETVTLKRLEDIIDRGRRSFIEVGEALLAIRDGRLYRTTHSTFDDYCRERWDLGRNYVNKQIRAAQVVAELGTTVPIPVSERQVRELARVEDPKARTKLWVKLTKGHTDQPTADEVAEAVDKVTKPKAPAPPPPPPAPPVIDAEVVEDEDEDGWEELPPSEADVAYRRLWEMQPKYGAPSEGKGSRTPTPFNVTLGHTSWAYSTTHLLTVDQWFADAWAKTPEEAREAMLVVFRDAVDKLAKHAAEIEALP